MSSIRPRSFRFSTSTQFDACLFDRADRGSTRGAAELRPFAPFARPGRRYETSGAHAPAVTPTGEILWRDDVGRLHRLASCSEAPESSRAPDALSRADRVIATRRGWWVASSPRFLQLFEEQTLARLLTVELPGDCIADLTGDGRDGVFALVERDGVWQAIHVDCIGRISERIVFSGVVNATGLVYLHRALRFVVLAGNAERQRQRLAWFGIEGGAAITELPVAALRSCFAAHAIGSDSSSRVFLAGADDASFGGSAHVVTLDADGNSLGDVALDASDAPASGVIATRDGLIVTGPRGLLRFGPAETVPDEAGEVFATLITPVMQSPEAQEGRRWLRIEALADLPGGSTLEMSLAATDDESVRGHLNAITTDRSLSAARRIAKLRNEPEIWREPVVFHGRAGSSAPLSAPLFDVRERYLLVSITLRATAGARLPELSELNVLYPGRTLMEQLPSIYQRVEARPGSFLRRFVGVLEATTQDLDGRIAAVGSLIHPSTAPEAWLDFVARWLGLPWDDALRAEQKREIVRRAPEIAKARGTRAGLEALLESMIPGTPRRFRVTDATADFGFAALGASGCPGSALPAMLAGRTRWSPELDTSAVLGLTRLPCPGQLDDGARHLTGKLRIDVAATARERKEWEPWLLALITDMVPLTTRIDLRWVSAHALRTNRLDGTLTLERPPSPHLGTDAVTGLARLPEPGARLPVSGPNIGTRLG